MGTVYFCLESLLGVFVVCCPVIENGYTRDVRRYGGTENANPFSGRMSIIFTVAFQRIFSTKANRIM